MTTLSNPIYIYLLMLLAGAGVPTMAAMNGGLGARIGDPVLASTLLIGVALLCAFFILFSQSKVDLASLKSVPVFLFFGGVFVTLYVFSATYSAPRIGVGNAIAFALLGQLFAIAIIDHFGVFGAPKFSLTLARTMGLILIAVGVFLVRKPIHPVL